MNKTIEDIYKRSKEGKQINREPNTILHAAKKNKNDEFYTYYSDVKKQLDKYYLEGKKILLPCDKYESNFTAYCETNKLDYTYSGTGWMKDFNDIDFTEYDIIITNPPFSKIQEFYKKLLDSKVDYIIICSLPHLATKQFFNEIKNKRLFVLNRVNEFFDENNDKKKITTYFISNKKRSYYKEKRVYTKKCSDIKVIFCEKTGYLYLKSVKDIPIDYPFKFLVPINVLQENNEDFNILETIHPVIDGKTKFIRVLMEWKEIRR